MERLVEDGQYLTAGLARISPDGWSEHAMVGAGLNRSALPRMRVASISKAATAYATLSLVAEGILSLQEDVLERLGWRGPPGITLESLLNHTSGLRDDAGYIIQPPDEFADFIGNARLHSQPGTFFTYSNLNYMLLGHLLEAAKGASFDAVLRTHALSPAGINGGFNWAGVPPTDRTDRLPMYQRQGADLVLEADGPDADWDADLIWQGGRGVALRDHALGRTTSVFSPHAGLRANVLELAQLARLIGSQSAAGQMMRQETWRYNPTRPNGRDCDGLFPAQGRGVTLYEGHPRIPGPLVGHAGHALGFTGGAWYNTASGTAWAYTLTGSADLTEGQSDEVFYPDEELLFLEAF
ncbi:MAG: serine hydrolase domain-containing protein [Pseudomonadota bacterium]